MLLPLLFIPLCGFLFISTYWGLLEKPSEKIIKYMGLIVSTLTFLYSLFIWYNFDNSTADFQFIYEFGKLPLLNINCYIGIDGISLFFIILTTLLIPICIIASWNSIKVNWLSYIFIFIWIEIFLIFVFTVLDLLAFYIFFESTLIPMFLLIGVWGSRERKIHAAYQFFLYTLLGSVLMLLAILYIYQQIGTTDIQILHITKFEFNVQLLLWLAFFASFAVKVPMIPFHIWLPEAHVEAPTAGSVLLAGILLKMGTYGFLRFSLPMFPDASIYFTPLIYLLSVLAIIYTSFTTIRQIDLKKVIAYSSIGHMAYVTLGIFSFNTEGIEGSIFIMLSHGLVSSALFLSIGIIYDRYKTRIIKYYRGLTLVMPLFSIFFFYFILANTGVPGSSSFIGEFLVLVGTFKINTTVALLASLGIILSAIYSIWLYNRVMFGQLTIYLHKYNDITLREFIILLPFILLILLLGICPWIILDSIHASVLNLVEIFDSI